MAPKYSEIQAFKHDSGTSRQQFKHNPCKAPTVRDKPRMRSPANLPAPIVSPARRMSILPISLFVENGSKGMGRTLGACPEYVELRKLISTSADMFFVNTL